MRIGRKLYKDLIEYKQKHWPFVQYAQYAHVYPEVSRRISSQNEGSCHSLSPRKFYWCCIERHQKPENSKQIWYTCSRYKIPGQKPNLMQAWVYLAFKPIKIWQLTQLFPQNIKLYIFQYKYLVWRKGKDFFHHDDSFATFFERRLIPWSGLWLIRMIYL